jgi:magnesium chelatase subunit D
MSGTPLTDQDVSADARPGDDVALVAAMLAVDGAGLGGVVLDHPAHDLSRRFVDGLRLLLPAGAPMRRVPIGVSADRLIGGVDLAATLGAGRLISERGVFAAADGGIVVLPMAERASVSVRTTLCEVLESGAIRVARDGVAEQHDARVIAVLLDESVEDEALHPALVDRVAFRMSLDPAAVSAFARSLDESAHAVGQAVREARRRLASVTLDDTWLKALCSTADLFGVASVRATLFALRAARAHAALSGRLLVNAEDAEVAARLVLAPRATRVPAPPPSDDDAPNEPPPHANTPDSPPPESESDETNTPEPPLEGGELLRAAVAAALPPGLLAQLLERINTSTSSGRVGAEQANMMRGRPRGARSGMPRGGARLHLLETLRAAAPWQRVRVRSTTSPQSRVAVRREDFRIRRFIEKTGTTVHFIVDASGSAAVYRLGEAKGAVELLLAESYARRDRVSLMAFRGTGTEVLLPPTRALARAKRVLAALPGGGGTPMATAIDGAAQQALATRRGGSAPLVVILSDGRANIARDGTPGRAAAERDALLAARAFAQFGISAMFVDTSPRGEPMARKLAEAMRARYVFLPNTDAKALGSLVKVARELA